MDSTEISATTHRTIKLSWRIARSSLRMVFTDKQILVYLPLSVFFISISTAIISTVIYSATNPVERALVDTFQHKEFTYYAFSVLSATLSSLYTILVSTIFVCATSSAVLAKLRGEETHVLSGIADVLKKFPRVVKFAAVSLVLPLIALIAHRRKLSTFKFWEALGSAYSMNIALIAPGILTKKTGIIDTVQKTSNQIGNGWKEQLLFKIVLYLFTLLLIFLAFIPHKLQHTWFGNAELSHAISILVGVAYAQILFVANRIIGCVYTTTLYHHFTSNK